MKKTSISPRMAFIVAFLFFLLGIWQFSSEAIWRGLIFVVLALAWVAVGAAQRRKRDVQKTDVG